MSQPPFDPPPTGLVGRTEAAPRGGTTTCDSAGARWKAYGAWIAASLVIFGYAWIPLLKSALGDELHSYAPLIPVVVGWLIWQAQRHPRTAATANIGAKNPGPAVLLGIVAAVTALAAAWASSKGWITGASSSLTGPTLAWVLAVWAGAFWILGSRLVWSHAFPFLFLIFTVPLPDPVVNQVEKGLQYGSAGLVEIVFRLCRLTYLRDDRMFWLDGLRFEVAQECSGIRSTLVLFITSLLAGYLLLRSPRRRLIFALAVIPLGLLRNTLRICVITLLSVYVDPRIIHSPLHHRGGPLFFAISLVPLFALLWWFQRKERGEDRGAP
ncbi:MAG: archaeosortase/exosortase family protein [Verrucomicrobiales bacterium]|nr:archaeosortase/exosortase family protein [Verrucomicrobiales bacterium]